MIEEVKNLFTKELKNAKIQKWDLLITKKYSIENQFRGIDVEITRDYEIISYVLRIFEDREDNMGIGLINGSSMNKEVIKNSIKYANQIAKLNSSDKIDLPQPGMKYKDLKLTEDKIVSKPLEFLQDTSEELTKLLTQQKKIVGTFGKLRFYITTRNLLNSEGLNLDSKATSIFIEYALKAEKDDNLAEYWAKSHFKNIKQLDLNNRIKKWASIAFDTLRAEDPPSMESATVLFPPIILKDAIKNTIGYHITGKSKIEKISKIKIGEKIASDKISIIDNGLLEGGLGTSPWDGEGIPQRETNVIKNGVFESRIYDLKHAKILNTESTGNGIRSGGGSIENTFTNLEIKPGDIKFDKMVSQIDKGLIIEEFSWLNPSSITGDFGAEIRNGYLIKNGEISDPIKGGNLSGNVFEMMKNISGISKERKFEENCYLPYIIFENLILSS